MDYKEVVIMKLRIIVTILILLLSFSIVSAADDEYYLHSTQSLDVRITGDNTQLDKEIDRIYVFDVTTIPGATFMQVLVKSVWGGSTENSDYAKVDLFSDGSKTNKIGEGILGFIKGGDGYYRIQLFITEELDWGALTGGQYIYWTLKSGESLESMEARVTRYSLVYTPTFGNGMVRFGDSTLPAYLSQGSIHTCTSEYIFSNPVTYLYDSDDEYFTFILYRDSANPSKLYINNSDQTLRNETTLYSTDWTYYNFDIGYPVWDTHVTTEHDDVLPLTIDFSELMIPIDETSCRIEIDNTDLGDQLDISYYNIDELRANPIKYGYKGFATENLYVQILIDRGTYKELLKSYYIIDETDNTISYDTTGWTEGLYYAQINTLYRDSELYAVRDFAILSQPANYSISVYPNILSSGDNANIIYKSLNQSRITVFDNDNTSIDTWLNVIGQSQIIYQIPIDADYEYAYNDWYVYLNDSGNVSNNIRYNFTVDWKVYVPPTVTPTPPAEDYNVSIEESVDELKTAINPLLELVYGLSSIFVDNPDYDHDKIVTPAELKVWFNSLISIVVLIVILIGYKVLKRK